MQFKAADKAGFTEIVTTDECVKHLYLDIDADTTLLATYIAAARRYVEKYCNVPLVTKTVTVHYDTFPNYKDKMFLPLITEESNITSLSYIDEDNATQTISTANIILANIPNPNYIIPKEEWPSAAKNIKITYEATAYHEKSAYKSAVLLLVGHQFQNRDIIESKFENSLVNILKPLRLLYNV